MMSGSSRRPQESQRGMWGRMPERRTDWDAALTAGRVICRLAAFALLMSAAACSMVDDLAPTLSPSSGATEVAMKNPRFSDSDPHEWEGGAPWSYAVHGTDVSKYQRSVNWHKAKSSGVSFAFIKATEGGDRVDDYFAEHWQQDQGRRRAAQRLSFLLFLPPRRRTGALVHQERAQRPLGPAAGAGHGVEPGFADLQAEAGPRDGAQRDAHLPVDGGKALRQEADHLHLSRFLR